MMSARHATSVTAASHAVPSWLDLRAWPFDAKWARVTDGALHYIDEGRGAPIVLAHGTPTWSFEWRHVIASLRETHRVIALDHLGFGLSERPRQADYSPEAHARRFREFMASLALTEPVTLVVHDFGGPIAIDWALAHPERVARLVVVNSWMWSFTDDAQMMRRAKFVHGSLGRWMYRRLNASLRLIMPSAYADRRVLTPEIHAQYLAPFVEVDAREQVLWALARSLVDSSRYFASLYDRRATLAKTPVDIFWGMRDSAFSVDQLKKWRAALSHASVTPFETAGHWPHEEESGAFISALRRVMG